MSAQRGLSESRFYEISPVVFIFWAQFVLDPVVTNIIGASAARAQMAFPVHIYWLEFNINHEQNAVAPLFVLAA